MSVVRGLSSVDILKELNSIREERTYFHDLDLNGDRTSVVCKVIKVEDILILKSNFSAEISREEEGLLERMYKALEQGNVGLRFTRNEIFSFMNIIKSNEGLKGVDELVVHLRGIKLMDNDRLGTWKETIRNILDNLIQVEDETPKVKKIVVDDGLTEMSLIVNTEEQDVSDILEGDVIDVQVKTSRYTWDNHYILATYDEDVSYEVEEAYKIYI